MIDYRIYNFISYAFETNKKNIMTALQSQSLQIKEKLQKQKKLIDELLQQIPDDDSGVDEKKIRTKMYEQYTIIEEIMQQVDGQVIYDWDEYFMSVACLAALRSKDPSTPVRYCHYYPVN